MHKISDDFGCTTEFAEQVMIVHVAEFEYEPKNGPAFSRFDVRAGINKGSDVCNRRSEDDTFSQITSAMMLQL